MSSPVPPNSARRTSGPWFTNGVLLACVVLLSVIVVWQNFVREPPPRPMAAPPPAPPKKAAAKPSPPAAEPPETAKPVPRSAEAPEADARRVPTPPAAPKAADTGQPPLAMENPAPTPNSPSPPVTSSGTLEADELATIRLFASSSRSVVHITTHALQRDFFTLNVTEIPQGTGTGFVWDKQGHIVTNFHVIEDADTAHVGLADHSAWPAKLVGVAPDKDLAVLKIDAPPERLVPLPVGSSHDLQVGQKVFAIGNPFGLDHTLTTGIISALGRQIQSRTGRPIKDVIQTDAAINPGNSGGPLLSSQGLLVGVNSAIYSPSGAYAGIGFAIPVDTVKWVVPELIAHGKIIRPGLAITVAPDRWMERIGVKGVLILAVEAGSEADRAGLRPTRRDRSGHVYLGDIIIAVGAVPIHSTSDLVEALERHKVGDQVALTVLRGKQQATVTVRLDATN